MQKRILIISTLLLIFLSKIATAQEPWTLEQCIKHAFENNIQIKQQVLSVKMSEAKLLQSKLGVLPNLNASANHSYNFGRSISLDSNTVVSGNTQSDNFSVSSYVNLFQGFQNYNSINKNKFDLLASVEDVEKIKNNIALSIASAYLQILFSDELVASASRQVELSKLQVERTTVLVKAGSLPEGNLLEIEAQLASDELQLVNAQNQLDLSYLAITQYLDIKNPVGFKITKPNLDGFDTKLVDLSPTGVFESAQQIMPQILSAGYRVSSAEKGVLIATGAMYPTLNLNGTYSSGFQKYLDNPLMKSDPFFEQIKDKASTTVAFGLQIPIFNGYQIRTGISNSKISLNNALLTFENEKNILYKDIQQAYTDAIAAQKKLKASQKNLSALEEAFRYAEQKFNLGLVTSYDYTNAKNKLSKAEADLLQAKYELIFKSKILEFYKGVPLSL